jgi:hypothetical protein
MSYEITQWSKNQAERLKVTIKPSTHKNKKIDVFDKDGKLLASIGDTRYKDYGYYLAAERAGKYPKGTANRNRYLYRKRHAKDAAVVGTPGFYANEILW